MCAGGSFRYWTVECVVCAALSTHAVRLPVPRLVAMDVMDTLAVDQCGGFLVVVLCEAAISSFTGLLAVVLFCKLLTHRNSALALPYKSCFSDCALRRETVWSVTVAMHWGERVHDAEQLHFSLQRAAGSDQIKVHGCTTMGTGS